MKTILEEECEKLVDNFMGWIKVGDEFKATFTRAGKKYEAIIKEPKLFLEDAIKQAKEAFKDAKEIK